jgi:hypothetical protein
MSGFAIADLTDAAGYWTATVTMTGTPYAVTRERGSWACDIGTEDAPHWVHVNTGIAAALQVQVRAIEKQRRSAVEEPEA